MGKGVALILVCEFDHADLIRRTTTVRINQVPFHSDHNVVNDLRWLRHLLKATFEDEKLIYRIDGDYLFAQSH